MTEQAAKLTVKVKLHAAQPVVIPTKAPPARLSKLKVFLGVLLLILLSAAGYFLWQQWVGKVPNAVAADHQPLPELSADAAEELAVSAGSDDKTQVPPVVQEPTAPVPKGQQNGGAEQVAELPATITTVTEAGSEPQTADQAAMPEKSRALPGQTLSSQTLPSQTLPSRTFPEGFSRIVLAATMEQLEPGAAIDTLVAQQDIQRLYLFTELKGYAGQQLIHRWSFAGKVQTEALLTIEDSPWRTYSEKWLLPDQLGSWRVEIVDQAQKVLYQHDFQYQ